MMKTNRLREPTAPVLLTARAHQMADGIPATIVVRVDGSPSSIDPLRQGARITEALRIGPEAVTIWDHETPTLDCVVLDHDHDHDHEHEPEPEEEEEAEQLLSAAGGLLFGSDWPDWFHVTTRRGREAQVLSDKSAEAELLIGDSRGRSGVVGLLSGSVSAACAERVHCSVSVIDKRVDPRMRRTPHGLTQQQITSGCSTCCGESAAIRYRRRGLGSCWDATWP